MSYLLFLKTKFLATMVHPMIKGQKALFFLPNWLSKPTFFCFIFIFSTFTSLFTQTITPQDSPDSTELSLVDMPPLKSFTAFKAPIPYYQFLWIFNDGQFINGTRDSVVHHIYDIGAEASDDVEARVYSTGTYSDNGNDPPPKLVVNESFTVTSKVLSPFESRSVEGGDRVRLQKKSPKSGS